MWVLMYAASCPNLSMYAGPFTSQCTSYQTHYVADTLPHQAEKPVKEKAAKGRKRKEPAKELSKDEETIKRLKVLISNTFPTQASSC